MGVHSPQPVGSDARSVTVRVEVLGPLRLLVDDQPIDVPGARRRAVLALLALGSGHALSVDTIIDAVWPHDPPKTGRQAVHSHVSRLRRHLGPAAARLRRVGAGYALDLADDELDASQVRGLSRMVSALLATQPERAAETARAALLMWRGPALEEFSEVAPLTTDAVALKELYLRLRDDALEATMAAGGPSVTAEAAVGARDEPLRERTATLLMRALAIEGRTAEAMATAASYRRRLAEETGLDPGPGMATLEQQIAAGDLAPEAAIPMRSVRRMARPTGPMVGRDHDRAELLRLIDGNRLVTVTGPGGVGKTRLALDVVAELSEREIDTQVVTLAEVADAGRVPDAVVSTLALRVMEESSPTSVAEALADREMVLVLDNAEHVVAACRELIAPLLSRAPQVRILTTSRVTLHMPGEYVVRLQPLPLPKDAAEAHPLTRQPSIAAFLQHAQRRDSSFALTDEDGPAVVEIVRRLDGLPLAIELAASQLPVLPVAALRDRLGRALDALSSERPDNDARHRTLRATIDWSYRLLGDDERALLRALAPFPAGVDLTSVELLARHTVEGTDPLVVLTRLVDASLVAPEHGRSGRYALLETVRDYLLDELDDLGEREEAEQRFIAWASQTAIAIGEGLRSPDEVAADLRLRAELPNLRAARDFARGHGKHDVRVDITLALDEPAVWRDIQELWMWSIELAHDPALRRHPKVVEILGGAAEAAWLVGDPQLADRLSQEGLRLKPGSCGPDYRRRCWSAAAALALFRGEFLTAKAHWLEAAGIADQPAPDLAGAALAAGYGGDVRDATELLERARRAESAQPCMSHRAFNFYVEGEISAERDPVLAGEAYTAAVDVAHRCGAAFIAGVATVGLASVWSASGDVAGAAHGYLLLLDYWNETGNATQLWTTVRNIARLLTDHGRHRDAALLVAAADRSTSASVLTGEDAARAERQQRQLADALGPEALGRIRDEAMGVTAKTAAKLARDALAALA